MDKDTRRKRRTSGQRVAESISINGAKGRSGLHIETCLNGLYPERDQRPRYPGFGMAVSM
jgi:hypothetical protein